MLSRLELAIDLLHSAAEAALATHSTTLPGYPFASQASFVADARHRPVLLLSALAEHSRNLAANPRASLMLAQPLGGGETARLTLVGELRAIDPEPALVARYLRYHPHAERFLQLGDFGFRCFEPQRLLAVGGFARAAWLEGERLLAAPSLSLEDEASLLARVAEALPAEQRLLGVDAYGADLLRDGLRSRHRFSAGPVAADALLETLVRELAPAR